MHFTLKRIFVFLFLWDMVLCVLYIGSLSLSTTREGRRKKKKKILKPAMTIYLLAISPVALNE